MTTITPSKKGVQIDTDPVPDFVEAVQVAWEKTYAARQLFLDSIEQHEDALTNYFPIRESYDHRLDELKLEASELYKVGENLLRLLVGRAEDLFTKMSVKLDIPTKEYEQMLTVGLYTSPDHGPAEEHPEKVDFRVIWRQLEQDFAGEKADQKTNREAATLLVNSGWDHRWNDKNNRADWVKKNFKKQKKVSVLKLSIATEMAYSGGKYKVSYDSQRRLAVYFKRGLQVLSDRFGEIEANGFRYMCERLGEIFWNSSSEFDLGQQFPFEGDHYSLTVVLRKNNLELKMDHALADMIVEFIDEHYWKLEGESDAE